MEGEIKSRLNEHIDLFRACVESLEFENDGGEGERCFGAGFMTCFSRFESGGLNCREGDEQGKPFSEYCVFDFLILRVGQEKPDPIDGGDDVVSKACLAGNI